MQEILTQKQFLDLYKGGQKLFSNCLMQMFDVANVKVENIDFKDCSILFCNFRNFDFRNAIFENCKIYYCNFYTGTAHDMLFRKCNVELTLFDNYQFSITKFIQCTLRLNAILNSNFANVDMSTSSNFNFITDLSQLTPQILEESIAEIMQSVERLDIGLRLKIKEMIRQDLNHYELNEPKEKQDKYATSSADFGDAPLTYGEVKSSLETFFYGSNAPYKTRKSTYETFGGYKK